MRSDWLKTRPFMERRFSDDVRAGLAVLAGVIVGKLLFGGIEIVGVVASFVGVSVTVLVMSLVRRVARHRRE